VQIVRINRRGNSLGVNLPKPYLAELRWGVGQYLMLEIEDGSLRFRPVQGDRLHQMTPQHRTGEAPHAAQQA
jgi:antitoxin component of MazEF toxin-antitoxin module